MSLSQGLTESQWAAVDHFEGPLLVLAGPGSGKTRVITRRIARLIERGVRPEEILAITFTNKAAREMADRVEITLPGSRVWVSTFHRFCARLLRRYAGAVGLQPNYTIYDTADQRQLLRQVISDLDVDPTHFPPGQIGSVISNAKNQLQTAEEFAQAREGTSSLRDRIAARAYKAYQQALLAANAVDFDDLLLHVAHLLTDNPELRHQLDARHQFILVDEYQDTNLAQYRIVAALSKDFPNLCATGDPDQSIYGWRGARIENILRFEAEFSQARVVRLEENFRSTEAILLAADRLIVHNTRRKAKSLIATTHGGNPVELLWGQTPGEEAQAIARRIRSEFETGGRNWNDFAILYRVNSLTRAIERALVQNRIPYQVAVGAAFYDRTEIKDLLSYLRLIHNPDDAMAFRRVVNTPVRGIGKQTQNKLLRWAEAQGIGLLEAAGRAKEIPGLGKKAILALGYFAQLIDDFRDASTGGIVALLQRVLDRTGYGHEFEYSQTEEDIARKANINELLATARQYDETAEDASLEGFLENSSLVADADTIDPEAGQVTLLTLHAAKGLEFPIVFIAGVEEGLLPHERSLKEGDLREIEEERRLLFVGVTRARKELFLSLSLNRDSRGSVAPSTPSRFLTEMGLDRLDELAPAAWSHNPEPSREFAERLNAPAPKDSPRAPAPKRPLLMTGASLLNGTPEAVEIPMPFEVGMLVRHPREGVGRVVEVGMPGLRRTVTVEFENGGRLSFVAAKCPLQPVGRK